jgi:alkylation response protein AidB-like acyl-CoA dehydrogenase
MDFKLTEKQQQFREEVRDFLKAEMAKRIDSFGSIHLAGALSREFSKEVSRKGWIGLAWPKEHGGQGLGYTDRIIMLEEMFRVAAPMAYHYMGDRQVGPGLIHFGSDFLKGEFLPKILNADVCFALLFSEPEAGSDLANCKTTAVEEGDHFIINGQKIWTSGGHYAECGWVLARTNFDPNISRYNSFSEIIVDMKSPGVTIRPIINIVGAHSFNEVFFDNVKVGKGYLVGKKDNGFRQIMTNLDYERAGIDRLMQNYRVKEVLLEYVKTNKRNGRPLSGDTLIRDTVAKLEVEYEVARLFVYYVASLLDQGKIPSFEAAMGKTICTLFESKLADVATTLMGLPGLLMPGSPEALFDGVVCESYLWSPSYTLQGGTVEVLKNIIAQRGLKIGGR